MSQTTSDRMPSNLLTASNDSPSALESAADALMRQAENARKAGDNAGAAKLMRAAAAILGDDDIDSEVMTERRDGRRQTTPETEKIKAMLREGWREAHELQAATGLNANRVHSLLGRLKNSRELKFEKRTLVQYRLVP